MGPVRLGLGDNKKQSDEKDTALDGIAARLIFPLPHGRSQLYGTMLLSTIWLSIRLTIDWDPILTALSMLP